MDVVYQMGFDTWSDELDLSEYLVACRKSSKYKNGTWYVLERDGELLSSLIVYDFGASIGIGSIATPVSLRRRGFAAQLIDLVIKSIEEQKAINTFFLYADINPKFHEKFGFIRLPDAQQKYLPSVCMVRGEVIQSIPVYF